MIGPDISLFCCLKLQQVVHNNWTKFFSLRQHKTGETMVFFFSSFVAEPVSCDIRRICQLINGPEHFGPDEYNRNIWIILNSGSNRSSRHVQQINEDI